MILFEKEVLANGLTVLVYTDKTTPMAVVNVLYNVGARDEDPTKTGFAHLFEHLMFGGSINIPVFDEPLQMAGGENNAYTTNDITNYYCQLPAQNIETAFWLESDRMTSLAFSKKSLDVQRKVVCEEFKEHYINKPYGNVWHTVRNMAYTTHPYKWMTIGQELSHIENAQLTDVKNFFFKHYRPCNAVLCVAGNVNAADVFALANKWFGSIEAGEKYIRNLTVEPTQTAARFTKLEAKVPANAIYKVWHMADRLHTGYYAADVITEVLSGKSGRLYNALVKDKKLLTKVDCYHTGSVENGLFCLQGKLTNEADFNKVEQAIQEVLDPIIKNGITENELAKAKNTTESMMAFEDVSLMSRANNLAFYELLGNAELINTDADRFASITQEQVLQTAQQIIKTTNCSTLHYYKQN
jgi:zinc protease